MSLARPPRPPRPEASPYLDRRPPAATLGPTLGVLVLLFLLAGLLWVRQANGVAETGRQIARLLDERDERLMQRAAARVALAQATDPQRLAERARALGFAPIDDAAVEVVTITVDGGPSDGAARQAAPGQRSPLDLVVPPAAMPAVAEPSLSRIPLSLWHVLEDGP